MDLSMQAQTLSRRLAREGAINLSAVQIEKMLATTITQAQRLERLVNDMLDVSRMNSGKLALMLAEGDGVHFVTMPRVDKSIREDVRGDAGRPSQPSIERAVLSNRRSPMFSNAVCKLSTWERLMFVLANPDALDACAVRASEQEQQVSAAFHSIAESLVTTLSRRWFRAGVRAPRPDGFQRCKRCRSRCT